MPVALGTLGWFYAVVAVVLGARFIWLAVLLLRTPDDRARGAAHVPLLAALPGPALRSHGHRQPALTALERRAGGQAARRSSTVTMLEASSRIETGVTAVSSPNSGSRLE